MAPDSPPRPGLDDLPAQTETTGSSQRSDADISESAEDALAWTSSLPQRGVQVMVENGWVTLRGELDCEFQRQVADRAVRHLMGVTGMSDLMTLGADELEETPGDHGALGHNTNSS